MGASLLALAKSIYYFNEILLPLAAVNVEMPLSATCSYFSDGKCPKKYQLTIRSRF